MAALGATHSRPGNRPEQSVRQGHAVGDTYQELLSYKVGGRLPNVQLIFPNVELRLDVAAKTGFVNLHLLVSPEDPKHVEELHRILQRLQF